MNLAHIFLVKGTILGEFTYLPFPALSLAVRSASLLIGGFAGAAGSASNLATLTDDDFMPALGRLVVLLCIRKLAGVLGSSVSIMTLQEHSSFYPQSPSSKERQTCPWSKRS